MKRESAALPLAAFAAGVVLAIALAISLRAPQQLVALIVPRHAAHRLDGRVEPGEYRFRYVDKNTKLEFQWSIQGDRLIGAISSPDTGWVAVGFGGDGPLMFGADIAIGYVDARGAHVYDDYANSPTGQVPDTTIGGHDDILASAGLQTAAGTTIEFERPLAAHDSSTDKPIQAGQTHVIMASAESKDIGAYHASGHKAVALLDLFNGPLASASQESLLPDHISDVQIMVATWMMLLLLAGAHGLATHWAARAFAEPPAGAAVEDIGIAPIAIAVLVELGALGGFAAGVAARAPTWFLGSALAVGLLALAAIMILYGRAFVRWEIVRHDRSDGIPW
ncbi:MAG: DOMON domain-containing protein [Gemmatimonadales bacterium]